MKICNPELWQKWVDSNPDPYGAAVIRYVEVWAILMEIKMTLGYELSGEVIEECSTRAAGNDITGFQHGAAIHILHECWLYGPVVHTYYQRKDEQVKHRFRDLNPQKPGSTFSRQSLQRRYYGMPKKPKSRLHIDIDPGMLMDLKVKALMEKTTLRELVTRVVTDYLIKEGWMEKA